MPPPEVWGPAVWTLFHTLAEKIREDLYPYISPQLFNIIVRICKFLPCPDCAADASIFLAKIRISDLKTKEQFKNTFYLFHNYVNAKKRKPLFNYSYMPMYGKYRLTSVVNNFIANYQTRGNMKLLTESFQRQFVIKDFKNFITTYVKAFIPIVRIPQVVTSVIENNVVTDLDANVVTDLDANVVTDLDANVVTDLDTNVVTDLDTNVVTDLDENIVTDLDENIVTDLDANVVTDLDANIVTDLDANIVTDLDANVVTDLDANVVTNLDANIVTDLDDNVVTDLDDNVVTDLDENVVIISNFE